MNTDKYVLSVLCSLAVVLTGNMIVGVVDLSQFQGVPWTIAALELIAFGGAAILPLVSAWLFRGRKRRVAYVIWIPCILYVSFLAFRLATQDIVAGGLRLLLWLAIAVLFTRALKTSNRSNAKP